MSNTPRAARPAILALALALYAACGSALAEKTDVIYMRNGDRITCEIKRLERGQLKVSTDGMGTVYVEWEDIAQIVSRQTYVVELQDGERVQGTLAMPFDDGTLLVTNGDATHRLEMARIVWVDPLKLDQSRIKRWDGSVSAGFDKTKANDDTSISASFDARRRAQDFQLEFDGSAYSRSQDKTEDTLRATFGALYRGLLEDRWYWAALGSLERNDEQGIDLRTLAGAGYGRFLLQTGRTLWSATTGLAVVNEQRAGDEDAETNLEALLSTDYEFFTYDTPKTRLRTSFTVYPSLTESGRVRTELDVGLSHELIEDLFIELSVYDTYDNEPPAEGEKNDYGIVTSLGYTF
jgi:putative salt-induced outer membrane protein YdiY